VNIAGAEFNGASEHEFEIHRQPLQSADYGVSFSPYPPDGHRCEIPQFMPEECARR